MVVFPCKFSYCLEEEIIALYELPFDSSLTFALERFRQDEARCSFGLMAVLETAGHGAVFLGMNARAGASCLGYVTPAAIERVTPWDVHDRQWVVGGVVAAERAEFHWFFPDCPSTLRRRLLLSPPQTIELVVGFAASGVWPANLVWSADEES